MTQRARIARSWKEMGELTNDNSIRTIPKRRKRIPIVFNPIRHQRRNSRQKETLRNEPMEKRREHHQRDTIAERGRDEVARALNADGLGHTQRLAVRVRVQQAEFALYEECCEHDSIQRVDKGEY